MKKTVFILVGIIITLIYSCKKDNDTNHDDEIIITGTVTDIEDNIYQTVKIGDQWWMAENLKTTKFNNGDPIPIVTDSTQWNSLTTGAYCNYDNDTNKGNTYGRLYNWFAVNDSRTIAPAGWHIPNNDEWTTLLMYCDNDGYFTGEVNLESLNQKGFKILFSGQRWFNGTFDGFNYRAIWWSSTEWDLDRGYITIGGTTYDFASNTFDPKSYGHSVRCVKD